MKTQPRIIKTNYQLGPDENGTVAYVNGWVVEGHRYLGVHNTYEGAAEALADGRDAKEAWDACNGDLF